MVQEKMYIFGGNHNGRYLCDLQVHHAYISFKRMDYDHAYISYIMYEKSF